MTTAHRRFKDDLYGQFARVGRAVAAPRRLELLDLLSQGARTVEALAREAGMSVANASQHLRVLRAARLVETERKGLFIEYSLADDEVGGFFLALRRLAESRLAEVEQVARAYIAAPGRMERISGEEALRRARDGVVTILDVRPAEEYRAGHIAGAISIPVGELRTRMRELPKVREIVAYCRGPYCVMAIEAVALLQRHGFRAQRMAHGVMEWRARGWAVETGDPAPLQGPRRRSTARGA